VVRRQPSGASKLKDEAARPEDEQAGYWSRQQLIDMDILFCMRMRLCIARGLERPVENVEPPPMRRAG